MKTLTKQGIDELRKQMPVLSEKESREIVAGAGYTFGEPLYTMEEYAMMCASGSWSGGWVDIGCDYVYMLSAVVVTGSGNNSGSSCGNYDPWGENPWGWGDGCGNYGNCGDYGVSGDYNCGNYAGGGGGSGYNESQQKPKKPEPWECMFNVFINYLKEYSIDLDFDLMVSQYTKIYGHPSETKDENGKVVGAPMIENFMKFIRDEYGIYGRQITDGKIDGDFGPWHMAFFDLSGDGVLHAVVPIGAFRDGKGVEYMKVFDPTSGKTIEVLLEKWQGTYVLEPEDKNPNNA